MSEWEPTEKASRAAWKDRGDYRRYLDREGEARERAREEYRARLGADCAHGVRVRKTGEQDGRPVAMLVCPRSNPNCGISYLPAEVVYREWRDSQPVNPAGTGDSVPA